MNVTFIQTKLPGTDEPGKRTHAPLAVLLAIALSFAAADCRDQGQRESGALSSDFTELTAGFLKWHYATHPVAATNLGIHDHDHVLTDWSAGAVAGRISSLNDWLERLQAIDRTKLDGHDYYDHRILEYAIRAQLLELEEVISWQRNPMMYVGAAASAVSSLSDRNFAPLAGRMKAMVSRMDAIASMLAVARENLRDVPPLWVELAVRNGRGLLSFLEDDLAAALAEQGLSDVAEAERDSWNRAREATVARVTEFVTWLEEDLAPRASGDFRLGRDVFERKILYEEHVSLSADQLRDVNEDAIRDYRDWVAKEAARIDPEAAVEDVMTRITTNYPSPEELLPTAREFVETAKRFVIDNDIVTLPSDELPIVRPTPKYARTGFASMSTPGPFERQGREAYYNITNVDPDWTGDQKAQHLSYFNYPGLLGVTIHEVMPGHFVQLLYEGRIPTDVRKVFTPASLVEGWAHYTEQMMIDEGLGDDDPAIRLGQLRRALQRHARWYAGLSMHVYGTSLEEASQRFQEIAFFAPFPALRETQRGTYNPTYLYYALGRMQIFKLREDYSRHLEAQGETFSLREFHDTFLTLGLPITLARSEMIADSLGPSL